MSIQFGGSKSKEKSSSTMQQNSDFNRTDMPVVPDWISNNVQNLGSKIGNFFASTDPAQLVAGLDPLQTQAAGAAQALTPRTGAYDEAANITRGITGMSAPRVDAAGFNPASMDAAAAKAASMDAAAAKAASMDAAAAKAASMDSASLLDGLQKYMSPYTGQVVDAALADFDFGAGETRAQQALDMAGAGAFGGSGAALTRAATEDALTRGRASTSANLRDQGFRVGADLSGQDAARRQQAAAQNAAFQQQAAMENAARLQQASTQNAMFQQDAAMENAARLQQASTQNAMFQQDAAMENAARLQQASTQNAMFQQDAAGQNASFQQQAAMANAQAEADNRNRALGGAGQIANLASQLGGDERAIIGTQAAMGDVMRGVWQDQVSAPVDALAQQLAFYTGLPLEMFVGSASQGREAQTGSQQGTGSGSQFGWGFKWAPSEGSGNAMKAMAGAGG